MGLETAFANLLGSLAARDAPGVERAVLQLTSIYCEYEEVPDQLVECLPNLLRREHMYESPLAGYLLNFFEFEAPNLTPRQKALCLGFLNAHGERFSQFHSQQVVSELRTKNYLR